VWGADRVGVRISPLKPDQRDARLRSRGDLHPGAAQDLDRLGVAYLHVGGARRPTAPCPSRPTSSPPYLGSRFFRLLFSRTIIAAGGHTARTGPPPAPSSAATRT